MMDEVDTQGAVPPRAKKSETMELLRFVLFLGVGLFLLRTFIFAPFSIPSESMLPRLLVGDYLIVSKWNYGYSRASVPWGVPLIPGHVLATLPERGDVAVFKAPPGNHEDYIKRVIGLPGDTVQVRDGRLYLNGKAIERQRIVDFVVPVSPNTQCLGGPQTQEVGAEGKAFCRYAQYRETLPNGRSYNTLDLFDSLGDNTPSYRVPAGHLFMMGDDRDVSADSRFVAAEGKGIGFVPVENLVGRARFIFFSTDGSASWLRPWTWPAATRWGRIGTGL